MRISTSIFALLAASAVANAQNLQTEITVDRTVNPDVKEATRPNGTVPALMPSNIKTMPLNAAEYTNPGAIVSDFSILPPAPWEATVAHTPYRGYATLGYLPLYNLNVSAGYRLADSESFNIGVWGQYNGNSYHGDIPSYEDAPFSNHVFSAGINGAYHFSEKSILQFQVDGSGAIIGIPYYYLADQINHMRDYKQKAAKIAPKVRWMGKVGSMFLSVNAGYEGFKFFDDVPEVIQDKEYSPVSQNSVMGGFTVGLCDDGSDVPWLALEADGELLNSNQLLENYTYKKSRMTQGHFKPYLAFDGDRLNGRVGVNLSMSASLGGRHVRVAPDVAVEYRLNDWFKVYASAKGGEYINHMSTIFELNPYIDPAIAYMRTNIPVVIDAGLVLGRFSGLELSAIGGYASARDQLSPVITIFRKGYMKSTMEARDFNSWYAGGRLSYNCTRYFTANVSAKFAGSNHEINTWYEWVDSPDFVVEASVKTTPIEPLDVALTYQYRHKRKAASLIYDPDSYLEIPRHGVPKLGDIGDLGIEATYRISPTLSVFLSLDNVLCKDYLLISGMPAQKFGGLVGASCKF